MHLLLHMGNYKTGSTFLEHLCYVNADRLCAHGIYYGKALDAPICSHAQFSHSVLREALTHLGFFSFVEDHPLWNYIQETPQSFLTALKKEALAKQCDTILLSHEGMFCECFRTLIGLHGHNFDGRKFSINPLDADILDAVLAQYHRSLHDVLLKAFSPVDINIILYQRETKDYLISQYNQFLKAPWYEKNPGDHLPDFQSFLSYAPVREDVSYPLEILSSFYGKDAVSFRAYEDVREDLAGDFFSQMHLPKEFAAQCKLPDKAARNESLSQETLDFILRFLSPEQARDPKLQALLLTYSQAHPDPPGSH